MESLVFTLNAVLPIILCIVIGYLLKMLKIFPDSFWPLPSSSPRPSTVPKAHVPGGRSAFPDKCNISFISVMWS